MNALVIVGAVLVFSLVRNVTEKALSVPSGDWWVQGAMTAAFILGALTAVWKPSK